MTENSTTAGVTKKKSISKKLLLWLAVKIFNWLMLAIGNSNRKTIIEGNEILQKILSEKKPVIFCFWHNRIFFLSYYLYKFVFKKGLHLTIIISQSEDAELIARVVNSWGGDTVRGSTSKGARKAVVELLRAINKKNSAVVITPDGPRGPKYHFQAGAVSLAQMTGALLVPVCFDSNRKWVFNSWDKFIVPKFFARSKIIFGEPLAVPRDLNDETQEAYRLKIQEIMLAQVDRLESQFKSVK